MNRRKAARVLRVVGYVALCVPFALMLVHRRAHSSDLITDGLAMAFGAGSLCVSLVLRGYRRDARAMGILGIVAVLCIAYAWGVS